MFKYNEITIDDITRRLNDGIERTDDEILKCKEKLIELQHIKKISLKDLDDLCFADSSAIFDFIFC